MQGSPLTGYLRPGRVFFVLLSTLPDPCEYIKYVNVHVLQNSGYLCDLSFILLTLHHNMFF